MSGVKKTVKKIGKKVRNVFTDAYEGSLEIGEKLTGGMVKSQKTKRKERNAQKDLAAADRPIPMPDEEELERAKRRRNSARYSGRASTIFTDEDRLG